MRTTSPVQAKPNLTELPNGRDQCELRTHVGNDWTSLTQSKNQLRAMYGLINVINSDHGTSLCISSRNTPRLVRLLDCTNPKLVCFMPCIVSVAQLLQ